MFESLVYQGTLGKIKRSGIGCETRFDLLMICKPYYVDQKMNARYLSHEWGIGIELDEVMQRTDIAKAIRRILVEEEGSRMRQKVIALKDQIKDCIKDGGSSYNSLNKLVQFISSF